MAAADAVDKKGIPPPALKLAWQCLNWNTLPYAGGLRDQPIAMMRDMNTAIAVYNAVSDWRHSKNWVHFQENYPNKWEIVGEILKRRHAR